jgi:hypothetical protein
VLSGRTAGQASSGTQTVSAFFNSTSCCGFSIDVNQQRLIQQCAGQPYIVTNQITYTPTTTFTFQRGDSGSPIFDGANRLVGMFNWCEILPQINDCGCIPPCTLEGGGTSVQAIQSTLQFDRWSGTATVPDQTIGTFNTNTAQWRVDNGNGRPNTCSTATTKDNDDCFTYGQAGDIPITGDWDGSGATADNSITVGVFRPSNTTLLSAQ